MKKYLDALQKSSVCECFFSFGHFYVPGAVFPFLLYESHIKTAIINFNLVIKYELS